MPLHATDERAKAEDSLRSDVMMDDLIENVSELLNSSDAGSVSTVLRDLPIKAVTRHEAVTATLWASERDA